MSKIGTLLAMAQLGNSVNFNEPIELKNIYQAREEFDDWGAMNRRKYASVKSSNPTHRSHKENVKRRAKRSASKKSKRMNRRK